MYANQLQSAPSLFLGRGDRLVLKPHSHTHIHAWTHTHTHTTSICKAPLYWVKRGTCCCEYSSKSGRGSYVYLPITSGRGAGEGAPFVWDTHTQVETHVSENTFAQTHTQKEKQFRHIHSHTIKKTHMHIHMCRQ